MHAQTRRQREVLDFITRHIESHGYRPSYAVIARRMGLNSRAGIGRIVRDLETQGLLTRRREDGHFYLDLGTPRNATGASGVEIEWLDVPQKDETREPWENRPLILPEFILGFHTSERIRGFRVRDAAMAGEGIYEDDIVLVELRQFVRDGDRVVAVVAEEHAVLRKYYRDGARVELRSAGPVGPEADDTIRLPADKIEIIALYRGLLRPVT
jgi:repressor LexA